ncbi:MAG: RecX family transcriptional regulator [Candidatus Omnitrophica bacterium]|nr:RecX family transcriptional regulator [Candidatus Omnitrophota bacterium]MDD5429191.1 RecX family transcriptional regulator [Candidatus Omnitrophota bacterium]
MESKLGPSEEADYIKALNYSFLLLRYRLRSKNEMISRLKKKKYGSAVIKRIVRYLSQYNYINDKEFCRVFIESGLQKGWGPRKIDFNLAKLGVDVRLRSEMLGRGVDYSFQIQRLIDKKDASLGPVKDKIAAKKKLQKILRYLLNRGFSYQDIMKEMEGRKIINI